MRRFSSAEKKKERRDECLLLLTSLATPLAVQAREDSEEWKKKVFEFRMRKEKILVQD